MRDRELASDLFRSLVGAGAKPCGLVARDILRLEAGLVLYGNDIDEDTNPIEAGLEFAVDLEKDFVGKGAITEAINRGVERVRVGIMSSTRSAPRRGEGVYMGEERIGIVTSGTFSPTIERGIGMAYIKKEYAEIGKELTVGEERKLKVRVEKMPFYDEKIYGWRRVTSASQERHD
jgi:aminomethyltransferase